MVKQGSSAHASASAEFASADLHDARLDSRLDQIVAALEARPSDSFPVSMSTEADLEAFYRFVRNERVTFEMLLAPHIEATVARAADRKVVLAVHDTTEFRFEGDAEREGLGTLGESGHGFLAHFSMAVSADGKREPLGILAVEPWARTGTTPTMLVKLKKISYKKSIELENEGERWLRVIDATEATIDGAASLIHIMDSEADGYGLFAKLVESGRRFVVRSRFNRVLEFKAGRSARERTLNEFVGAQEIVATRPVPLSRRGRHPGGKRKRTEVREEREATLAFRATSVVLKRPDSARQGLPQTTTVNVVLVREVDPPDGVEPVEWTLMTTEQIETADQILAVVDRYRARWIIEEYFKALKTGCAYEGRQLESMKTLLNALAIFIPIAWNMLRLRTLSRAKPESAASEVLSPTELDVLRRASRGRLPEEPTVRAAMLAIARLGGHLKRNGDPGWLVLGRGYMELLALVAGFKLAGRRCDQS